MRARFAQFFQLSEKTTEEKLREIYKNCLHGDTYRDNSSECAAMIEDVINNRKGARSLLQYHDTELLDDEITSSTAIKIKTMAMLTNHPLRGIYEAQQNEAKAELYRSVVGEGHPRSFSKR